jgi:hypothetical protein
MILLVDVLASSGLNDLFKIVNITIFDNILYFAVDLKQTVDAFLYPLADHIPDDFCRERLFSITCGAHQRSRIGTRGRHGFSHGLCNVHGLIADPSAQPAFLVQVDHFTYINPLAYAFKILLNNEFHATL